MNDESALMEPGNLNLAPLPPLPREQIAEATEIANELTNVIKSKGLSKMYRIAKYLGDYNAVRKNKVGRRILWRLAGKLTGRTLGKIFR